MLFERLLQSTGTGTGALYISNQNGVPPYSTTFWRPNKPLSSNRAYDKVRYHYSTENGFYALTFVGIQEAVETISEGTLLRVSLARWWCPEETPDVEERCYMQLSGWFL